MPSHPSPRPTHLLGSVTAALSLALLAACGAPPPPPAVVAIEPPRPAAEPEPVPPPPPARPPPPVASDDGRLGAKHLVIMYAGSMRAPANVTRTKDEARRRAEEAVIKSRSGVPFAELVALYSDEPSAATRGGDLGTFKREHMVQEFGDAVVTLKVGETSGVVETRFGFHLILRTK